MRFKGKIIAFGIILLLYVATGFAGFCLYNSKELLPDFMIEVN